MVWTRTDGGQRLHRQQDAEVGIASREVWAVLARERRLLRVGTEIGLRRSVREEQANGITDGIHRRYLVLLFFCYTLLRSCRQPFWEKSLRIVNCSELF